jgi:hypothetical protein
MLDAIGYILIFGLFFGFPLYFVGYGAWVAARRGIKGQPVDREAGSSERTDGHANRGAGGERVA